MLPELPLYDTFKRVQLRPIRIITVLIAILIVLTFIFFILWFDTSQKHVPFTEMFFKNFGKNFSYTMIGIQFLILCLFGTGAVESRIRMDTTTGIIYFHKLTPLSSHNLIWGYILGSTFEIYTSFLIFFISGFLGIFLKGITFYKYLFSSFLIIVSSVFFHIFAVMNGLGKPLISKWRAMPISSIFFIILGLFFCKSDINFLTPLPSIFYILAKNQKTFYYSFSSNIIDVPFFYFYLPPFIYSSILWILFGTIFYFSSKRRIISEEYPIFSKKESVFLLSIICFLVIGRVIGILNLNPEIFFSSKKSCISYSETIAESFISLGKILIFFSSLILLSITIPTRLEFIHQFIRKKKGEKIFWWENDASSLTTNFLILIISILSILLIDTYISLTGLINIPDYWFENILRTLIFISSMYFFNLIIEGCRLKFEKGADNISSLIIIFWFLVIPFIYIIYALNIEKPNLFLMGLSPLPFLLFVGDSFQDIRNPFLICLLITNIILFSTFLFWKKAKTDFGRKYG